MDARGVSPDTPITVEPITSDYKENKHSQVSGPVYNTIPMVSNFTFYEILGKGTFSKVKRAVCKDSGNEYAVKILDQSKIEQIQFSRIIAEIRTMATLSHPNICQLYSAFCTNTKIYIVLEYCWTDLCEYIAVNSKKPISEEEGRRLFMQLLSAVTYLHSIRIVHRDIKPENILLTGNMRIKLCDFGFAFKLPTTTGAYRLQTYCGSLSYGAPEVITGSPYCGEKADIWSLGVNLYVILTRRQPFWSRNPCKVRAQVMRGVVPMPKDKCLRERAFGLIKSILNHIPEKRPTIRDIWSSAWIQEDPQYLHLIQQEYRLAQRACREEIENELDSKFHSMDYWDEPVKKQKTSKNNNQIRRILNFTRRKWQKLRQFTYKS